MLNLNKRTKTNPTILLTPTLVFNNCSYVCVCACVCVCHCAQLLYTTQHRTLLIIFPLILQTIIIAQVMSTERGGGNDDRLK